MRSFFIVACVLSLTAELVGGSQDAAPAKEANAARSFQAKTEQKKDTKSDEKKDDANKKDTGKAGGKGGKKGGKPLEDTSPPPPPVAVTEPDLDAAALKELEKFQGEWRCLSMTRSGITLAKTDLDRMHLKNEGRRSTITFLKEETVRSLVPNPNAKPAQVDFLVLSGPDRGKIKRAIYSFDNGQLKICAGLIDVPRPTSFESKGDGVIVLEVWEKVKK